MKNLPYEATEEQIGKLFASCGKARGGKEAAPARGLRLMIRNVFKKGRGGCFCVCFVFGV